jgi:hypothetical protein
VGFYLQFGKFAGNLNARLAYPMTLEVWQPMFIGMVISILLINVVQWVTYRERIYGLYTLYMLTWLT